MASAAYIRRRAGMAASWGLQSIRVSFDLDTDATEDELATLARLTERYCVVWQSVQHPPAGSMSVSRAA
jgi:uncharacterized OsmC-like protein